MSDLIDTTEMYLKTVYELLEEGVPVLRARIVERLGQSGPTVSETVARMERDGLVKVGPNREVSFTELGFDKAASVMRRHRLAERLLLDVIKVDIKDVHNEACRWEHVISDDVADKIDELLERPDVDPFGNPVPPANATVEHVRSAPQAGLFNLLDDSLIGKTVRIERMAEALQVDADQLAELEDLGVTLGAVVEVLDSDVIALRTSSGECSLPRIDAAKVFVSVVE